MKLQDLTEGGTGSGRPSTKVRPDKNLWFQQRELWLMDLRGMHGNGFDLLQVEEDEEGDIFATDKRRTTCYGAWRKDLNQGVTFKKPRPLQIVMNPRIRLRQMMAAAPYKRGI